MSPVIPETPGQYQGGCPAIILFQKMSHIAYELWSFTVLDTCAILKAHKTLRSIAERKTAMQTVEGSQSSASRRLVTTSTTK